MIPKLIKDIWESYASYLLAGLAILALGLSCYLTYTVTDSRWQSKWDTREAAISKASAKAQQEARDQEYEYQTGINAVAAQGAKQLAATQLDAANARSSLNRLQQRLDSILTSAASQDSSITGNGKTAAQKLSMLADVLEKSLQRNGDLAEIADDNYERGLTCQASYEVLLKKQSN